MSTHKALLVKTPGELTIVELPTPSPGPGEVLVQVAYAAIVQFDAELCGPGLGGIYANLLPLIPGLSLAGTVVKVGENVGETVLKVGDKVIGFALPKDGLKAKGVQEYAVLPYQSLAKVPSNVPLEAAAAVPDNFVTAWWTLSHSLKLDLSPSAAPEKKPWSDRTFVVYGASATSGQYTLQILALFGCTRVIAIASKANHEVVKSLGASHTIDYHDTDWAQQVLTATGGKPVDYTVDTIATEASVRGLAAVTDARSTVAIIVPVKLGQAKLTRDDSERARGAEYAWEIPAERNPFDKAIEIQYVKTFSYYQDAELYETLLPKILPPLLERGLIRPTATRLIDASQGKTLAERVKAGFDLLISNSVSGYKVVVKVQDE